MTKLKKCLLALTLGAGFGISFNVWAYPGCDACNNMYTLCQAGDAARCKDFDRMGCYVMYSGTDCAVF